MVWIPATVVLVILLIGGLLGDDEEDETGARSRTKEEEATSSTVETTTEPEEETTTTEAEPETTLSPSVAKVACENAGSREFPYGFKAHWFLEKYAEEWTGDEWFMKVGITVTNAFDAERKFTLECKVSGTNEEPVVESFDYY